MDRLINTKSREVGRLGRRDPEWRAGVAPEFLSHREGGGHSAVDYTFYSYNFMP